MASTYQTLTDVYADVRYLTGKDSTLLQNADLLRIANKYYLLLCRELIDLNEDLYAEISYTALVNGQREYPLPVDNTDGTGSNPYGGGLVKLQRVEITYDGSNWRVASPIGFQEIPGPTVTDADVNRLYDKDVPRYVFKDRSVFILPVPGSGDSVASGNSNLRIFWVKRKAEMTAATAIPDLPKDFLSLLTEGMLIDVFRKYGRINDADRSKSNWEKGIEKMRSLEQSPDTEQQIRFMRARENYG